MGNYGDDNHLRAPARRLLFVNFCASSRLEYFRKYASLKGKGNEATRFAQTAFVIAKPELVNPFESFQCSYSTYLHANTWAITAIIITTHNYMQIDFG